MKSLSSDALAALAAGEVVIAGAARFEFGDEYRLWSGAGTLNLPGVGDFSGVQAPVLIIPVDAEIGGGADGVRIQLSKLEPQVAASIEDEDYHQKPATIWRLIFNAAGTTLLDASVWFRGRVDTVTISNTGGGEATIDIMIEGAARDMSRRNSRVRSDTDQRALGGSTDGGLKSISHAGEKTLYWGGEPSIAGRVVNGGITRIPFPIIGGFRFVSVGG